MNHSKVAITAVMSLLTLLMGYSFKAVSREPDFNISADSVLILNHRYHYKFHNTCVKEYITKIQETISPAGSCQQYEPLKLSWTKQYYPHLSSDAISVRYWKGSYQRSYKHHKTYLRELVDECRGKILSEKIIKKTAVEARYFNLENPNLNPQITKSYQLFALTEAEAQEALKEAHNQCRHDQQPQP